MGPLVEVLWFFCHIISAYSLSREGFPSTMCLSYQASEDCLGGRDALTFNGVWLNVSIFVRTDNMEANRYSEPDRQWIEMDMELGEEDYVQQIDLPTGDSLMNISGTVEREEYYIEQLEHGGGQCNCLEVYFSNTSNCLQEESSTGRTQR